MVVNPAAWQSLNSVCVAHKSRGLTGQEPLGVKKRGVDCPAPPLRTHPMSIDPSAYRFTSKTANQLNCLVSKIIYPFWSSLSGLTSIIDFAST